jgi:hypothetical protein
MASWPPHHLGPAALVKLVIINQKAIIDTRHSTGTTKIRCKAEPRVDKRHTTFAWAKGRNDE